MSGTVTVTATLSLGSRANVINLTTATVDCSKLFVEEEATVERAKKFKLLHNKSGNVLHLKALDSLRHTDQEEDDFLPTKVYVRSSMQEIFDKMVRSDERRKYVVVFGSPGVGKSVLSFLAALCCACFKKKQVLFLRKTTRRDESISVFWITPSISEGEVTVEFDRMVKRRNPLNDVHEKLLEHIFADDLERDDTTKLRNPKPYLRSICDGPQHAGVDHVGDADLVTSGGYKPPKDEAIGTIIALPLSVWTHKEVIQACRHLFNVKAVEAKRMFDVCGGNIRRIASIISKQTTLSKCRDDLRRIVKNEGSKEALKLAIESTSLSSVEESIDRLRAMVATPTEFGYDTVQYIGPPFLLRLVRSMISMDETLSGLQYAKNSKIQSLYGWHFELFGHKIFQVSHQRQVQARQTNNIQLGPACHSFDFVQGDGTGNESVKQLDKYNLYWTPGTSNFANIDAAIALNRTLYCIQYTVSASHTFNCRTFAASFWEQLLPKFRESISNVIVVFVVPEGVNFRSVVVPESQRDLMSSRISCENGIDVVYRKARTGCDGEGDESDDDDKMEEDVVEHDSDSRNEDEDDSEHNVDEADMDESFSDDDCGEEGFDDEEEVNPFKGAPPCIYFQRETLLEDYDVEKGPLKFLNLS